MSVSSRLELNTALDRWRGRGRGLDPMKAVVGDGSGIVHIAGTNKIIVELFERGSQMIAQAILGTLVVAEGDVVTVVPLEDRAPSMLRVLGRDRHHIIFAQLIWSDGPSYVNTQQVNEPWMIDVGTGTMTAIGTHRFPPHTLEATKGGFTPLGIGTINESNRYRVHEGTLFWRSRVNEVSLSDGGAVYPFLQYTLATGWERMEPNARTQGIGYTNTADNARGEALDVDEDGTLVFVDTVKSNTKLVWRREIGVPLYLWTWQVWPNDMYTALPPDDSRIDSIDAGSGTPRTASFGMASLQLAGAIASFIHVYRADQNVVSHSGDGLSPHFFQEVGIFDDASYILTWRADGGVYRLRQWFADATGLITLRLDFGDGNASWSTVNEFVDSSPRITQSIPAPYRSGVFIRSANAGLFGAGNFHNAINYYGPATLAGELISTIWHVTITATSVTKTAVVSVVTPAGTSGTIVGFSVSNGKLYFSIGASGTAYTNPHIAPGIYELDPVSYSVRQVCGLPLGTAAGGWAAVWGDRKSVSV